MTDTPTTPRKPRKKGQGRKKKTVPGRRFLLPIWCTPDEYAAIMDKHKTTEGRAVILLNDQQAEIERLKAALKYYADTERWHIVNLQWTFSTLGNPFIKAQDALKGGE